MKDKTKPAHKATAKSFNDVGARPDLDEQINAAWLFLNPRFGGLKSVDSTRRLAEQLEAVEKQLADKVAATDRKWLLERLRDLPPLEDQIALDRKQFPKPDTAAEKTTQKFLDMSRKCAFDLVQSLVGQRGTLSDDDKLVIVHEARRHVCCAAVYMDRLDQTEKAKPKAPRAPQP